VDTQADTKGRRGVLAKKWATVEVRDVSDTSDEGSDARVDPRYSADLCYRIPHISLAGASKDA
jgi:hypothetical protein